MLAPTFSSMTHVIAPPAATEIRRFSWVAGLALAAALALAGLALRQLPGLALFSPMILALLLGLALRAMIGSKPVLTPGLRLAARPVLRAGIILLGLQLTASEVATIGARGLLIVATSLVATFFVTRRLGVWLRVERGLAELLAAGTSICGASAIVATNAVTRAPEEDVAYAVACVTLFGTIAMLLYPVLPLGLSATNFGLWSGACIHEVGQVVAAAYQNSEQAGETGTIAKLARVAMLAPLVLSLGFARRTAKERDIPAAAPPVPWFVFGFVAMIVVASLYPIPHAAKQLSAQIAAFLLATALAAMGFETSFAALRSKGIRPLLLAASASLFIALFSFLLLCVST
ncbi:YeiH family protein [Roseiterribacter gracilis]|uniref:Membrane protein n=1 Tax=Roseiterribacter gracilis TaxID=2812848 RepID=A0A8S8X988_9PROT|nr:membrane protein [Rhodospirillales bacterium TMPK1]